MSDYYTKPTAELKDDTKSKNRIAHSIIAATTTFFVVPTITIGALFFVYGKATTFSLPRAFFVSLILSIASGFVVLPFRTLRWYWAILAGALLGPVFIVVFGIIHDMLT